MKSSKFMFLFVTFYSLASNSTVPNCNFEFTKAYEACKAAEIKMDAVCKKIESGVGNANNPEVKNTNTSASACIAKTTEFTQCQTEGTQAINKCEADRNAAEAAAKKAEEDRIAAQKKIEEGTRKENEGNRIEAEAAARNQSSAEAIQLKQAGQIDRSAGETQREFANTKMVENDRAAIENNDMASTMKSIMSEFKARSDHLRKAAEAVQSTSGEILKQNGGDQRPADTADGSTRPTDSNSSGGAAGSNQGQGQNPSQGQGQAGSPQQKSQDQAGGAGSGGGGMPSLPSGGAASSAAPKVAADPKQDCNNPTFASSNPVCACRQNPGDSRCGAILAADKNSQTAKKAANMYSGENGGGGAFSSAGGGYKDPKEKNISQHGQFAQGAGGSVGKGVGSGQGSKEANYGKEVTSQSRKQRDQSLGRSRGGGGGGGGSGAFSAATNPNQKIPSTFAAARPGAQRVAYNPKTAQDLRLQMQNRMNMQRRGPSGTTGPDGITGPHTDQFKKIRVRYAELMGL